MKKLLLLAVMLTAAVLPLAGCASASVIQASLGQAFEVPIHHDAVLTAEDLRLTFQQVSKDSRCPTSVQCVTAGEAVYTIRFTKGGTGTGVTFSEPGGGGGQATATFLGYVINASLLPYPEQPGGIPPEDYSVRLTITRPPLADAAPEDDMAAMYAAVIRRLLTTDNTTGPLDLTSVYLVAMTRDATPIDPMAAPDPHLLAPALQEKISSRLADLAAGLHWVGNMGAVPLEGVGSTVTGGGVVVNLGNLHPGEAGTFQVYGGLYLSNVRGTGRVYILSNVNGQWQVSSTTGVVWTS